MTTLTPTAAPPQRLTWYELGTVAAALAALIALQLALTDSHALFHAQFWLDELFTFALVADPELPHALQALAGGVDTNPPCYHLLLRLVSTIAGGPGEVPFRCFALLSVFLALVGMYAILRELFPPSAALAGVLAVWCHPLILRHAFEARFYGPLLAALVWYTFALARALRAPRPGGWRVAVALLSVLVCTLHYFGVITLSLVTLCVPWANRPWGRRTLATLAVVVPGPLALAACAPFFLGQRAALSVGSWMTPPDLAGTVGGLAPLLAVFCLYYLRDLLARHLPAGRDRGAVLGLVGMALLVPALTLFSLTVQPATMARYVLPALAALAPLTACLSLFLPRAGRFVLCLAFAAVGTYHLADLAALKRGTDRQTNDLIAVMRALPADTPVVFEFTRSLYVVGHYAPDLCGRCYFLDFERDQLPQAGNHRVITRDVARAYHKFYGGTGLLGWEYFTKLPRRYAIPGEELGEPFHDPGQRFPGFTPLMCRAGLYELVPSAQTARGF